MRIAENKIEKIVRKLEELKSEGYTHSSHLMTRNHGTDCIGFNTIDENIETAKNGYLERPGRGLWMNKENQNWTKDFKVFGDFNTLYSMI